MNLGIDYARALAVELMRMVGVGGQVVPSRRVRLALLKGTGTVANFVSITSIIYLIAARHIQHGWGERKETTS